MTRKEHAQYSAPVPPGLPIRFPDPPVTVEDDYGFYATGIYRYRGMAVIVNVEDGRWHLSVSATHPIGYHQLKELRYMFMPDGMDVAQIFPRRSEFVKAHRNCFHLWQV